MNASVVEIVTYDPQCQLVPRPIALMPDQDYFVMQEKDGSPIGVIRIERARRAVSIRQL